jgi:hypothetical protein
MTHSYATRAWAIEHMSNDFFGLQAIASMACVNPRTLQTWFRQETHRAKPTLKQPREYERAMGIILLDLLPNRDEQIAKLVFTNFRTLREWRVENRYRPLDSDLTHRTFQGVETLKRLVEKKLRKFGRENFLTDKMLWPDPNLIYEKTWKELDYLFYLSLIKQQNRNLGLTSNLADGPLPKFAKRVYIGPHVMRYTEISREGQHFPLESYQATRPTGHLIAAGTPEALKLTKISEQLLPHDWKMKDKVVPFKSRTETRFLTKIYEGSSKENQETRKLKSTG